MIAGSSIGPAEYGVPGGSTVFASAAAVRRRPTTNDIAEAIIDLLRKGFITGTVLHADGEFGWSSRSGS